MADDNVVVHWFSGAKLIICVLEGRVRPRKPAMAWMISQITWKAHKHRSKITTHHALDC